MVLIFVTNSPAVAERPRDASCLSVASIVQYVESNLLLLVTFASDLPLRTNKFCFFYVVFVHASCDNKDARMRGALCDKLDRRSCCSHSTTPPVIDR